MVYKIRVLDELVSPLFINDEDEDDNSEDVNLFIYANVYDRKVLD